MQPWNPQCPSAARLLAAPASSTAQRAAPRPGSCSADCFMTATQAGCGYRAMRSTPGCHRRRLSKTRWRLGACITCPAEYKAAFLSELPCRWSGSVNPSDLLWLSSHRRSSLFPLSYHVLDCVEVFSLRGSFILSVSTQLPPSLSTYLLQWLVASCGLAATPLCRQTPMQLHALSQPPPPNTHAGTLSSLVSRHHATSNTQIPAGIGSHLALYTAVLKTYTCVCCEPVACLRSCCSLA